MVCPVPSPSLRSALILTAALGGGPAAQAPQLNEPALLQRLTDVDWLHRPPGAGERTVQWSSYDRRSDHGPGNADDWYANDDRGKYLRVTARDGQKEYVMCEAEGPGVIARIWSANPSGVLHFDIDGARVWSVDFAKLCSGTMAPLVGPLAGMHGMGGNCYLPIPFGKRVVVSATAGDLYYHVDVWFPPTGTTVVSFAPAMLRQHLEAFAQVVRAGDGPSMIAGQRGAIFGEDAAAAAGWTVAAGDGATRSIAAGRIVRDVTLGLEGRPEGDLGDQLRQVLLVVRCGDEETVRVPVLDFFGGGPDWRPHRGAFLGVETARARCRWPMPMPLGGEVRLLRDDGADGWWPQLRVSTSAGAVADDLLFRASFHFDKGFPSRPFRDFRVLDASGGPGRFVGTALIVKNPHRAWWGEGDEKFYVDGEAFPSWFGTGTEDYFGYAWCCPEPFSSAFHGQPQCDGPHNFGFTAVHRMHVLDSVPFQRSFRFDLEVWHWVGNLQLDYATVACWYGAAGARSGLPPMPPAAARTLDRLPPPKRLVVDGAIEGESLPVVTCTGGSYQVQDVSFVDGAFSREAQLWWLDGRPGDALTLAVPVAAAGRYRLKAAFAKARDYAIVQCAGNGRDLGAPIDLFSAEVEASGPLELGTLDLDQGTLALTLRLVGHNPGAEPRHMVGLDYLLLEKLP